jgi:adenosylcobinamide-GDP ribazoletransferase
MKPLLAAIRFLTILPIPGDWGTAEADLARSVPWFPVVGLALGCIAAAAAWGLSQTTPPLVASTALVVLLAAFSGCLHLDGLADTADGFLSSRPREQILEIMKDSHVGAMGVIAIVGVLLVKFAMLASIPPTRLWPTVLLMPLAGRVAIMVHLDMLPSARPEGLGGIFHRRRAGLAAFGSTLLLAAAAMWLFGFQGLALWATWFVVTMALAGYVRRKIGGTTGDTLGAVCEILEALPPAMVAIWSFTPVR